MHHHKEYLLFIAVLKRQSDVMTIPYRSEPTALNYTENNTLFRDQAQTDLKLEKYITTR